MWKYTKETIINSLLVDQDAYGSTNQINKFVATAGQLSILRAGNYKFEYIVDKRIYKTPGYPGITGSVAINIANGANTIFANTGSYVLTIGIGMNTKFLGDYANANWYPFAKPILIDFTVTDANNNIADLTKLISDLITLAIPYNNIFARVTTTPAGVITISLTDAYAHIAEVTLSYLEPGTCEPCVGNYVPVALPINAITIVDNKEPFATGAWIQENLRFPSYPNMRYQALNADEYPIVGAMYTQYSFAYEVPKVGYYGMSAVGQKVESITRHIYYVLNALVTDFEQAVNDAFGDNVIVENNSVMITSANTVANDDVTVQLIADTYPIDDTATFTWTMTPATTGVTLTTTGELTADDTAVVGSTFTVTATSSNTAYKPANKVIIVIQG